MVKVGLDTPVSGLYMVGKTYASRLGKLGISTVEDLLHHYPFRYNNYSIISSASSVNTGEVVTIQGQILAAQNIYTKYGKKIQKAVVADSSGQINAIWFNQPFLVSSLKSGASISLSGKVSFFGGKKSLISPDYEILKDGKPPLHTGRLVPVYPETYGVSSKWLRSRIGPLLELLSSQVPDWLPEKFKQKHDFVDLYQALKQIHFPQNMIVLDEAKKRLAYDELLLLQLEVLERKKTWEKTKLTHPFTINQEKILDFISNLPFTLTSAQNQALKQILTDLTKKEPMNRLLEGDVGSGKTVVAAIALYTAFLNGFQSALMAPTEILANQHFKTVKHLLEPLGINVALLTSASKKVGEKTDVFIGTHALIFNKVKMDNLGLVIIDEQHRFGVEQRAKLISKGSSPHLLTMTATPIPRTVALTLYGDLNLSVIDQMPPGRKTVKTWVVPDNKRQDAYAWIKKQIQETKTQVFIVCPLVEESDKESMKNIKAATAEFAQLKKVFKNLNLGLLHGRMKSGEKEEVIGKFKKGDLSILVSTPVVEVGIDVSNASIMVIEAANRFGLSQLHQLRGRVGRSSKQAYCFLFTSEAEKQDLKRLKAMQQYSSGFKLAEIDLEIRGPGEVYGTKQHGFVNLKLASFLDTNLISKTRSDGEQIIAQINKLPLLQNKLKNYKMRLIEPN